jgi:predicted Zn-dependent protease
VRFTPTPSARASVDDDTRTRLAALGYVDTTAPPPAARVALRDVKDMLGVKRRSAEITGGLATGRLDRPTAIALTRDLVRDSPESAAFQLRLGMLLLESDDAAGAVAPLAEAVRLRPDDADTRTNYGQALLRSGRRPEAIEQFRAALALEPDHARGPTSGSAWRSRHRRRRRRCHAGLSKRPCARRRRPPTRA